MSHLTAFCSGPYKHRDLGSWLTIRSASRPSDSKDDCNKEVPQQQGEWLPTFAWEGRQVVAGDTEEEEAASKEGHHQPHGSNGHAAEPMEVDPPRDQRELMEVDPPPAWLPWHHYTVPGLPSMTPSTQHHRRLL